MAEKFSDYEPTAKRLGIDHIVAAAAPGVSIQAKQVTQAGATPFTVDLAAEGFALMADASFVVLVGGETAGAPKVDQSSITESSFNVDGGADTEVLHIVIIGQLASQRA